MKEENNRIVRFQLENYLQLRKIEKRLLIKEYNKRRCKGFKWNKKK